MIWILLLQKEMVKIPNRQKSNMLSSSNGTSQNANLKSPVKSKSITHYESSDGAYFKHKKAKLPKEIEDEEEKKKFMDRFGEEE